jgi:hypothetical protein
MSSDFPDHIKQDLLEAMVSPGCNVCTFEAERALAGMGVHYFTLPDGRRALLSFNEQASDDELDELEDEGMA